MECDILNFNTAWAIQIMIFGIYSKKRVLSRYRKFGGMMINSNKFDQKSDAGLDFENRRENNMHHPTFHTIEHFLSQDELNSTVTSIGRARTITIGKVIVKTVTGNC
jgi:hypothetical protein